MTVFADFLDLRTAVIEQVGRPDIADVIPRLTLMAEADFNRELRLREQINKTTLTLASGSVALPTDFVEMIGVFTEAGVEYVQQSQQAAKLNQCYYAVDGTNLTLHGTDTDVLVDYYASVPTLTTSMTTTNWMLAKYPMIYLYGVSLEAAKYMRDRELVGDMASLLSDAINKAKVDDERARYSRARVRVQGVTP